MAGTQRKWQPWRISLDSLIIVGEAPGKVHQSKSVTWNRVANWINIPYDWCNVTDDNIDEIKKYDKVVALGNVASNWLNKYKVDHLKIPHPSRLNRQWNDPQTEINVVNNLNNYLQTTKNMV